MGCKWYTIARYEDRPFLILKQDYNIIEDKYIYDPTYKGFRLVYTNKKNRRVVRSSTHGIMLVTHAHSFRTRFQGSPDYPSIMASFRLLHK